MQVSSTHRSVVVRNDIGTKEALRCPYATSFHFADALAGRGTVRGEDHDGLLVLPSGDKGFVAINDRRVHHAIRTRVFGLSADRLERPLNRETGTLGGGDSKATFLDSAGAVNAL